MEEVLEADEVLGVIVLVAVPVVVPAATATLFRTRGLGDRGAGVERGACVSQSVVLMLAGSCIHLTAIG